MSDRPTPERTGVDATLQHLRVLVVDDDTADQERITGALVEAGARADDVTCVSTLRAARRALGERPFGCVVLDLALPDAAGLEGVTVLAAAAPDTPLVVISGRPSDALVYAAMAEGADECLVTSELDADRLGHAVLRAVQRRRGADRRRIDPSSEVVFDALDAPIALLDGSGRIVAVNDAWTAASRTGGASTTRTGVGVNYLTVCDQAVGPHAEGAREIAAGIRAVLGGEIDRYATDYPCDAPDRERWFSLRVSPLGEMGGGAVVIHMDISDLRLAEQVARRQDERLIRVLDESSPIFALCEPDGTVTHVSDLTSELLGLHPNQVVGTDAFARIEPGDRERALDTLTRVLAEPEARERVVIRVLDGDGRWRDLDLTVVNLTEDPKVRAVAVTGSDVTDTRLRQIATHLEGRLLQRLPAAVVVIDDRGVIVYWNERAEALFGLSAADTVGRHLNDLPLAPDDGALDRRISAALGTRGWWEGEVELERDDGAIVHVHTTLERIDDPDIDFQGVVSASVDIAARRQLEAELEFQAYHDPLTGLANRRLFNEQVDEVLDRLPEGRVVAVAVIDLDDFKTINDRIGHEVGDQVLRIVGDRVRAASGGDDVVARIGGDEFVVALADVASGAEATSAARRILAAVSEPFSVGHHRLQTTATVGLAMSQPGSRADGLLRNADAAMYAAKDVGRNHLEVFDDELQQRARDRRELAERLLEAVGAGDIEAHLQPQFDLCTGALVGFEALARWHRPDDAFAGTADFIGLAEESGVVAAIDRLVLIRSCEALRQMHAARPDLGCTISANVSAGFLADPGFPDFVREVVEGAGFPPRLLCVEVVESVLADVDAATRALRALAELGVEVAIDDFGTGYSSLSRIQQFHVDYLKIDRCFVAGVDSEHDDDAVVSAVVGLATALGLRTIAEGVETEAQSAALAAMGVDIGQGFLWSAAIPVDEALALVEASGR